MPKSKKTKNDAKNGGEQNAKSNNDQTLIRAIRITPQILEAARKLKIERRISFYRLGLEAITERLVKEGYLKETAKAG